MGGRWKAKIDWTIIYNKKKKKNGSKAWNKYKSQGDAVSKGVVTDN